MAEQIKTIRFWVLSDDSVIDEATLKNLKVEVDDKEKFLMLFGDETAELHEVRFKRALGEHGLEIKQKCVDEKTGMYNPALENIMRFVVLVEGWDFPFRPVREGYERLPLSVSTFLDNTLLSHMYPSIFNNANFTTALKKLQEVSEVETK